MKNTLKQIKQIEINTKQLVEGLIAGNYHSVFKGNGIEFSEINQYHPGDDIRAIDWKVTARYNEPYVKQFIEERDLNVYFFVDISGSGTFGNVSSKKQKINEFVASLMFSAMKNNDKIGLILATDKIEKFMPARKGKKHLLACLDQLIEFKPESKRTNLKESLGKTSKILKRRGVLFIVSDFFSDDFTKPLKYLRGNQDIIAVNVLDQNEVEMPDIGYVELEDAETGEQVLVNTSDKDFRENYKKVLFEHGKKIKRIFNKYKIDMIRLFVSEDYKKPLTKFFNIRKNRLHK